MSAERYSSVRDIEWKIPGITEIPQFPRGEKKRGWNEGATQMAFSRRARERKERRKTEAKKDR